MKTLETRFAAASNQSPITAQERAIESVFTNNREHSRRIQTAKVATIAVNSGDPSRVRASSSGFNVETKQQ